MARDLQVVIGPYVECTFVPVQEPISHLACLNNKCSSYKHVTFRQAKFCDLCGNKLGDLVIATKKSPIIVHDVERDMASVLYHVSKDLNESPHVYLPNISGWTKLPRIKVDTDEFSYFSYNEITDQYRKQIMGDFISFFEIEIAHLVNAYGRENVAVKFGCVAYSM